MQFMACNEKMINIVTRSQTFCEKPFPCDSCLIKWNTLPDKSPAAFHCYIKWIQINCLWKRMPPCMHDASKSKLRFGPQCQWYEFKLFPPFFRYASPCSLDVSSNKSTSQTPYPVSDADFSIVFDANGLGLSLEPRGWANNANSHRTSHCTEPSKTTSASHM